MQLSKRLSVVASFVSEGNILADIGTDHGYIPIYLVKEKRIPRAYAMDINKGPLEKANEHIAQYGLENLIETRLSDGLEKLKAGEAETILIAGMGGALTVKILQAGEAVVDSAKELILSPHSEIDVVRKYILNKGFKISAEEMVLDADKYYTVIKAEHGAHIGDDEQGNAKEQENRIKYLYGEKLCYMHHYIFKEYIDKENNKLQDLIKKLEKQSSDSARARLLEVKELLRLNEFIREGKECRCQKQ